MGKKFLENFKVRFFIPRKMVLYLSRNFGILKPCTKIQLLRILDLDFWQISKQIYRKLKYSEELFPKFQGLPWFPRKMVLRSLTKFGIYMTKLAFYQYLISQKI